ncbi:uncharacterized protein ISCGN_001355 [Ixodes scapularis]
MTTSQQTTPLNPFVVALPEKLDFRRPEDWKRWFTRWERYRVISGLKKQDNETQVNTLVYAVGLEAEDILTSLKLTDAEKQVYGAVTRAFGKHFVPRTNVIYERAKFDSRKQKPHETVDAFVTDLYKAAETCDYGNVKEELIKDCLVVGLIDVKLSERLHLDSELTLETAITKARNSEVVKQQQRKIRGGDQATPAVNEVRKNRRKETRKPPIQASYQDKNKTEAGHCRWCGGARDHTKVHCPATKKTCNHCGKKGHYASVCLSRKDKHETLTRVSERSKGVEEVYLGEVETRSISDPWRVTVKVNGSPLTFKVDTGADITAISLNDYNKKSMEPLNTSAQTLAGPGQTPIATAGYFEATINRRGTSTQDKVFVIKGLKEALLSRPAVESLGILWRPLELGETCVKPSDISDLLAQYPKLTSGLRLMKTEYHIKVNDDAKPYAVTYPRRVPLPLLSQVENELERMKEMGVI